MPFEPHPDAQERKDSAIKLIKAILAIDDLYERHRRRFLSNCLWQLTEAEGRTKYETRFRSEEALRAKKKKGLRHEHVFTRKKMVKELIDCPDCVDEIVEKAVACVVTTAEHVKLSKLDKAEPEIDGWKRYKRTGIVVIDTKTDKRKKL